MASDHLKAALEDARQQLANAVQRLNDTHFEVNRLQTLVRTLAASVHNAERAEMIQREMQYQFTIGQAVEGLVTNSPIPLAPPQVMESLRFRGYDIDRYSNPGALVHQTLNRLAQARRIKEHRGRFMRNDFNQWLFG